jgi:hypothetical protein
MTCLNLHTKKMYLNKLSKKGMWARRHQRF